MITRLSDYRDIPPQALDIDLPAPKSVRLTWRQEGPGLVRFAKWWTSTAAVLFVPAGVEEVMEVQAEGTGSNVMSAQAFLAHMLGLLDGVSLIGFIVASLVALAGKGKVKSDETQSPAFPPMGLGMLALLFKRG